MYNDSHIVHITTIITCVVTHPVTQMSPPRSHNVVYDDSALESHDHHVTHTTAGEPTHLSDSCSSFHLSPMTFQP